jgi:hypothetical protein
MQLIQSKYRGKSDVDILHRHVKQDGQTGFGQEQKQTGYRFIPQCLSNCTGYTALHGAMVLNGELKVI